MYSGGVDTRPNKDLSTTSTPAATDRKGTKGLLSRLFLPLNGRNGLAPNPLKRRSCPPLGHAPNAAAAGTAAPSGGNQATAAQEQAEKPAAPGAQASQISKEPIWLGFARDLPAHYQLGPELGKGGNGTVRHCVEVPVRETTQNSYACKTVPKVPKDPQKTAKHLENLKREINVLMRLQGSLNIIKLEAVFEDEDSVHIIMENCRGGELANAISKRHYSERTAASYIRAVLRTLAQCHAHNVLHRDIKPGNFMLLNEDERAPVKAIDFGLAVPFEREDLPLNLGLEGTPWFMAPEALASEYYPASDVWSAGVMAHQLLTGKLPFDDKRNPMNPSLTAVWRSVLNDDLDFSKPWWDGISPEAKDFVQFLLNRDHRKRPSAKEALKHPWLQGDSSQRSIGKQLQQSVVARIQRFGSKSALKRSVLQMIASELLSCPTMAARLSPSKGPGTAHVIPGPSEPALKDLLRHLQLEDTHRHVDASQVAAALKTLGLHLDDSEVERLFGRLDITNTGKVERSMVAASQVDWHYVQQSHKEAWLELARSAFSSLDTDRDGVLRIDEIVARLAQNLPEAEVTAAVEHALEEAGQAGETQGLVFSDFVNMLKCGSEDSLDIYDQRRGSMGGRSSSIDRLNQLLHASMSNSSLADASRHGALEGSVHSTLSPARTADPTNASRMFNFDVSTHGSRNGSHHNKSNSSNHGSHHNSNSHLNNSSSSHQNDSGHYHYNVSSSGGVCNNNILTASPLRFGSKASIAAAAAGHAHAPPDTTAPTSSGAAPPAGPIPAGNAGVNAAATGGGWRFDVAPTPRAPAASLHGAHPRAMPAAPLPSAPHSPSLRWGIVDNASNASVSSNTAPHAWRFDTPPAAGGLSAAEPPEPQPDKVGSDTMPSNARADNAKAGSNGWQADSGSSQGRLLSQVGPPPLASRLPDGRHHGSSLYVNLAKCKPNSASRSTNRLVSVRE
mmetsp:Transcript_3723/g.10106  ORF Transcript_3723/g.10106 Transcript_3723/m.10106 type:complete len:957 (-) Transcript_3723:900-3770(-)